MEELEAAQRIPFFSLWFWTFWIVSEVWGHWTGRRGRRRRLYGRAWKFRLQLSWKPPPRTTEDNRSSASIPLQSLGSISTSASLSWLGSADRTYWWSRQGICCARSIHRSKKVLVQSKMPCKDRQDNCQGHNVNTGRTTPTAIGRILTYYVKLIIF